MITSIYLSDIESQALDELMIRNPGLNPSLLLRAIALCCTDRQIQMMVDKAHLLRKIITESSHFNFTAKHIDEMRGYSTEGYASILVKFREIREAQTEHKIAMLKKMASDAAAVAAPSKKKRRPRS